MKLIKLLLFCSLFGNIILGYVMFEQHKSAENRIRLADLASRKNPDFFRLYEKENFRKIFIEKNNDVYWDLYKSTYENIPVQSLLLACTYYMLTKDESIKHDIEMANVELKGRYGVSPDIKFNDTH
jgi:hypothetical protein